MAKLYPLRAWLPRAESPAWPAEEKEFDFTKEKERRWLHESPAFFVYRRRSDDVREVGLVGALETSDASLTWETPTDPSVTAVHLPTVISGPRWDIDACLGEVMAGEPIIELRDAAGDEHALWPITDPDQISLLQIMSLPIETLAASVAPPTAGRWPCVIFFLHSPQKGEARATRPQLWPGLLILAEENE